MRRWGAALVLGLLLPATASAQALPSPASRPFCRPPHIDFLRCPHPGLPWSSTRLQAHGQVIGAHQIPARQVQVVVAVPSEGSRPSRLEPVSVSIPAYSVTETTAGYYYPQRWALERLTVGAFQWRLLPAEFQPK